MVGATEEGAGITESVKALGEEGETDWSQWKGRLWRV